MRLHRAPVYVDALEGADVICTPSGVDAPPRSVSIDLRDFPESMQHDIEPGKVFFAYVDLAAEWPGPIHLERIEEPWGNTGPLHFEAGDARPETGR